MLNFTGRNFRQLEEMLSKAGEKLSAQNFKLGLGLDKIREDFF